MAKWQSKFCPQWDPDCETWLVHEVFDISAWPTVDIVGFEPIITRIEGATEDGSIAHHIDLFLCTGEYSARYPTVSRILPHVWGPAKDGHVCDQMIWAYDRGGGSFHTPKEAGFRVGKYTPYTRLMIQWHYLLPYDGVNGMRMPRGVGEFVDQSGMQITVTPMLRPHAAATVAVIDGGKTMSAQCTLYSYTILIHYTHTLYSYTILIHYTHTLYSYTILIH
jgi:hypothetical protein